MENDIRYAVSLIKSGQKNQAKILLSNIINNDPLNEIAWSWYALCAETESERIQIVKKILEINPDNINAQKIILKYDSKAQSLIAGQEKTTHLEIKYPPPLPNHRVSIPQSSLTRGKKKKKLWIPIIILASFIAFFAIMFFIFKGNTETSNPFVGNWYYWYYINLRLDSDFSIQEYADKVLVFVGTYTITGNNSITMTLCDPNNTTCAVR